MKIALGKKAFVSNACERADSEYNGRLLERPATVLVRVALVILAAEVEKSDRLTKGAGSGPAGEIKVI